MRIISGKKRGALLAVPEGGQVRPTADRVREGLFNVLTGGRYKLNFRELIVADIFAGTGALGLEAYSRGAAQVIFVENNPLALAALNANITKLNPGDAAAVVPRDATRNLAWPAAPAGLVFLDPPWIYQDDDRDLAHDALVNLIALGVVAEGALISIEHDHRRPAALPDGVTPLDSRKWGKSACTIATLEK
ncbi:MAG: RsmD family RNA methyltransferase [Alphaproteobacteria bacterium]|nr:RsmD family RNA methyltransferase [Alphaproteobacteria bacterium]